jgi:ribonuclease P/MRP protein subunit RPP40
MDLPGERTSGPNENYQNKKTILGAVNITKQNLERDRKLKTKDKIDRLCIIYTNADNLLNKITELKLTILSLQTEPHIIAITEIKPKNLRTPLLKSEFNINGYELHIRDLNNKTERGVLIYTKVGLATSGLELSIDFTEGIFLKIELDDDKRLIFGNLYRSPSSKTENNIKINDAITSIARNTQDPVLIVGDFNYGEIDWNLIQVPDDSTHCNEQLFIKTLRKIFLIQHVTNPTRQRGSDTPHTLDLVITNDQFISDITHLSPLGKSDHCLLSFTCLLGSGIKINPEKFNLHKGEYEELRKYINSNWDPNFACMKDVNEMYGYLKKKIVDGMELFIPKYSSRIGGKGTKTLYPFNKDIEELIHKKHRKWTRLIETKSTQTAQDYKKIRNKVRAESREIIKLEQSNIAKCCKNNPKKFWKFVNSKTKYKTGIGDLKYTNDNGENKIATDDKDKAEALVGFFSSVFTLAEGDEVVEAELQPCQHPMSELSFLTDDILKKLSILKVDKSPGLDNIHPRVLKEIKDVITQPLKIIFDKSINSGTLPLDWKSGVVTAIYKKGAKTDVGNYRPVTLTSIPCKIMESIIRDHIMNYLTINKLISNKQYGFRKGRSTSLQLLHMLDRWTDFLENGGQMDTIYTDFEKAFDKVSHKRLVQKLNSYGIQPKIINWINNFLVGRNHCVRVNGKRSHWRSVLSGIPQGTILGPLLFIIYINDLPNICTEGTEVYLFADDAKFYKFIKTDIDHLILQNNFNDFQQWSNKWQLKLNVKKCKIISFGRGDIVKYNYSITSEQVESPLGREEYITDLGIVMDQELKFSRHIKDKINKAFSVLGVIKRNFKYLNADTLVLLYKSMVRVHIEYGQSVWAPHSITLSDELERVQKRATKLIHGFHKLKYSDRLQKCGLPTLKFRRLRGDMIETYKILTGRYDKEAAPELKLNKSSKARGNSYKLENHRTRYDLRKYFFTNRIVNIWNSLPDEVVLSTTTNQFKNRLDKFWMNQALIYDHKADLTGIGSRSQV